MIMVKAQTENKIGAGHASARAHGGGIAHGTKSFRTPSGGVSAHGRHEAKAKGETMPGTGGKFPIRNLCLAGNTLIPLLNGSTAMLRDITPGTWAYGFDTMTKAIVPVQVDRAWLTRKDAQLLEVELDDGATILCTENHPFLLKDGSYKEAKDLCGGDSLMPLYRKYKPLRFKDAPNYEFVFQPFYGFWEPTHRMVYRGQNGNLPQIGNAVHHADGIETNNDPTNLEEVNSAEHRRKHFVLEPEGFRENLRSARDIRWADPSQHLAASNRMKCTNAEWKDSGRVIEIGDRIRAKKTGMDYKNSPKIDLEEMKRRYLAGETLRSLAASWGTNADAIKRRLKRLGIKVRSYKEAAEPRRDPTSGQYVNHKVQAVRVASHGDVYDLYVPRTSNIALACGIFVHNSDLKNAKHDIGRTSEPRDKVVGWINKRARELGGKPVGGGQK